MEDKENDMPALQLAMRIVRKRETPPIPEELRSAAAAAFIQRCFAFSADERPTAKQLLDDPFFA